MAECLLSENDLSKMSNRFGCKSCHISVLLETFPFFELNIRSVYPLAYIHGQDFESTTLMGQSNSV